MPIYEYRCTTCNHRWEVLASFSDPAPAECESCAATTVEKVLHPAAVHYKGSGFYATDYGSKRSGRSEGSEGSSSASSDSGSSGTGKDAGSSSTTNTGSSGTGSTSSTGGSSSGD